MDLSCLLAFSCLYACSAQFSSVAQSCSTLCSPMNCNTPGLPIHHQLPEFTKTYVHWVGDAIQPSHPLSFPSPPTLNLSQHQGHLNEPALRIRWPKYWVSASASVLPVNIQDWFLLGLTGLISFDLQETLKSLLQHHSSKASILRCSAFFMVQLSHPYMTIGKTIALTWWTFVGRVTSPLFNRLSRASLVAWLVKNLPAMCLGLIPGLGRSPGEGKGYPLQYSGLENSTDCIVHGVAKSQTQLSDFHLRVFHSFSSKEQVSFNFMAAVTICSDFWSPRK